MKNTPFFPLGRRRYILAVVNLFYSILVWLVIFIMGLIQGQMLDPKLILLALPMNVLLAAFLWMF